MTKKYFLKFIAYLSHVYLALIFSLLISSSFVFAEELVKKEFLVLPHVESNEDFFTGISLLNVGEGTIQASLTAYNQNGQVVGNSEDVILSQGARFLSSVADLFGYEIATDISWIKITYFGELRGFGLMGNDGQLARIPLQKKGNKVLILPYVISGEGLFTQLYVLNNSADVVIPTFTAFDKEGNIIKSVNLNLPIASGQKLISSVSDIFGPDLSQDVSWLKIESDGELMGLGLIGTSDRLFSVPME